jgi:antitoxin HicB
VVKPQNLGSSFEDFLEEEGLLEEATATAIKRVLAWQIEEAMKKEGLSKSAMARLMRTSRPALDRLLDPENTSVTLRTMQRAAVILGKRVRLDLVDAPAAATR